MGWSLPVAPGRVHDLLVTTTGATITIAVFALWMRTIVAGLVAGSFSPRTVTRYLDDRFQRATAGWMIAAVTVLVTVTLGSPPVDDGRVPPVATSLALATLAAALLGILLVVRQAAYRLDTSDVVHQLAENALRVLEETAGMEDDPPPARAHEPVRSIDATALGWVTDVDRHALVSRLPAGASAELRIRPGSFVAPGQTLLTVDRPLDERAAGALRRTVRIDRRRQPGSDLDSTVEELTDVARRAAGRDEATANEVLRYVEVVLVRLVGRRLPTGHVRDGDRIVTSALRPSVSDHVARAARQLRRATAGDELTAELAERILDRIARRADAVGDGATARAARSAGAAVHGDATDDHVADDPASAGGCHAAPLAHDQHRRS